MNETLDSCFSPLRGRLRKFAVPLRETCGYSVIAMSAITKSEAFDLIEAAAKAGTAPQPVVDVFSELSTLRGEMKKLGASEGC